jgi:hypothetical protein
MAERRQRGSAPTPVWRPRGDAEAEGFREDAYRSAKHLREPSTCTDCGVFYHAGRWTWTNPGAGKAEPVVCPACARIRDDYPAGELQLSGDFLGTHREEIDGLIKHLTEAENAEHPLNRIMDIVSTDRGLLIRTTDVHLPRRIGEALQDAYEGAFDFHYEDDAQRIRASWIRS